MFTIDNENTLLPIKAWLADESSLEESCAEQALRLAQLPFLHQWVCLMPDTHTGMGMPIGGVIASDSVIIPNAVGVDIGCGMAFFSTDIQVDEIRDIVTDNGPIIQCIVSDIMRNIPVGQNRHKNIQSCVCLDTALDCLDKYEDTVQLLRQLEAGYYQAGTLGGGNHFIELQRDDEGFLGIMIHSGSRNFGKQICDYFHNTARDLNRKWHSAVPDYWRLAFLPLDTPEGKQYINWMNLALEYAAENRAKMMYSTRSYLEKWVGKHTGISFSYTQETNCHHNYAALEHHYGRDVWVHRKGATSAQLGELAVIPGAMGSFSYVVEGLGNPQSFCSSSHGAGRRYSRKSAMQNFQTDEVLNDLQELGVVLGKHNKSDVAEESRFAYKNIVEVMHNQQDLVKPVKRLRTIGVIKG